MTPTEAELLRNWIANRSGFQRIITETLELPVSAGEPQQSQNGEAGESNSLARAQIVPEQGAGQIDPRKTARRIARRDFSSATSSSSSEIYRWQHEKPILR